MLLAGWSRADGYIGMEPRRRLDYCLLPALRVAGVRWVQRNSSTAEIAGLTPHGDLWLEVPHPLPRVRLVTQTRTGSDPACDIARVSPETTAICEFPLTLPASKPGTAVLVAERPGRLVIDINCPAMQLLVVAESYHSGWHAVVDGMPGRDIPHQRRLHGLRGRNRTTPRDDELRAQQPATRLADFLFGTVHDALLSYRGFGPAQGGDVGG